MSCSHSLIFVEIGIIIMPILYYCFSVFLLDVLLVLSVIAKMYTCIMQDIFIIHNLAKHIIL